MRDRDVRLAVRNHLARIHSDDPTTRVVEEMGVWAGTVRIDVAVINGELGGYEIKSDKDTLDRLPLQAQIYSRVFDSVTLVVGARHAQKASDIVPGWWSIIHAQEINEEIYLEPIRVGTYNPDPDSFLVAGLLWKEEAISILEEFGLAKGWKSKAIRAVHQHLADELPFHVLSQSVRHALKRRSGWLGQPIRD